MKMIAFLKNIGRLIQNILKPIPFGVSIIGIFLIQFTNANDLLNQTVGNFSDFGWFILVLTALIGIDWIYNSKIWTFIKIKNITPLDVLISCVSMICLANVCMSGKSSVIMQHLGWIGIIALICIIVRLIVISMNEDKSGNLGEELVDLNKLINNKVKVTKSSQMILIDERAVDYDLFKRDAVQNELCEAIKIYSPKHAYAVGLVGKWGSGKTTLWNRAKKQI